MRGLLSKLISGAVVIVVLLAIWRANGGDLHNVINAIWQVLSTGADILTNIWNEAVNVSSSSGTTVDPGSVVPAPVVPSP